jgi:uncharacterized protein (TIGR02466 family)
MIIHPIFPTPVCFSKLTRNLTNKELKFINDTKKNVYKNEGNSTSMNTYVLNNKELKNLKNELLKSVENYFVKIIDTDNNINPYITQSWINFTEETEFHHTHEHPNSYLSAVFYINADKEHDKIKFYKTGYQTILPSVREYNHYNSLAWSFPVETGDIVIFPSYLSHCVEFKKGKNVRTSLAFNIFIKGKIGSERGLTELTL